MPGEIKHSPGTVIRAVREAFPAQAAVVSALLAREGVAGFEQPIEGRGGFYALYAGGAFAAEDLTEGLGERYWIEELTFKRWPSCRGTHAFIEMALALREGVTVEDIAAIEVTVDEVQAMLTQPLPRKQAPATAIDAKFSVPFTVALALARGRVGLDDFDAAARGDVRVLALAGRVTARVAPGAGWQRGCGGALAITLHDGRVLRAEQADALGGVARPLDEAALVAKFADCAGRAARPVAGAALAEAILRLEACADVGALFRGDV
jgi:2-methylcitrate dehydratase PrpD